ncbi:MAG TPA: histidine kinase [Propionibacteriaceae bacterium]|jgi:signal transduction histidine kinase
MGSRLRWAVLRTVWLLVGAAIGLAAVLLLFSFATVVHPGAARPPWLLVALCLAPALLIGLLPGTRELEVTSARTLLGVTSELVQPAAPRAEHRWRTVLTVIVHITAGLLSAVLLVGLAPGAVVLAVANSQGRSEILTDIRLPLVSAPLAVLLALVVMVGCLLGTYGLGQLAAWCCARLLAPTAADRLEVAMARLQAESEHTRLARELHDGIGHALTIIGVQAAAGRRVLSRDPHGANDALTSIESTSRQALDELDGMLGLLRDETASRAPEPDLHQLPKLLDAHRSAGMELVVLAEPVPSLPRLVSTTAYRIVAEALTNAQRYAGAGPVRLRLTRAGDRLAVEVRSPLPEHAHKRMGTGRGLTGIAERVALFGGSVVAGADGSDWALHAEIPTGVARG